MVVNIWISLRKSAVEDQPMNISRKRLRDSCTLKESGNFGSVQESGGKIKDVEQE